MGFRKKTPVRLSNRAEKLAREYSSRNNISVEEFLEEAVIEKVEYEELRDEADTGAADDGFYSCFDDKEYYNEDNDDLKKRH